MLPDDVIERALLPYLDVVDQGVFPVGDDWLSDYFYRRVPFNDEMVRFLTDEQKSRIVTLRVTQEQDFTVYRSAKEIEYCPLYGKIHHRWEELPGWGEEDTHWLVFGSFR